MPLKLEAFIRVGMLQRRFEVGGDDLLGLRIDVVEEIAALASGMRHLEQAVEQAHLAFIGVWHRDPVDIALDLVVIRARGAGF